MSRLSTFTQQVAHRLGFDVIRYPAGTAWGAKLQGVIEDERPDVLVDVGAHRGSFSDRCRELGFRGRILSFEPNPREASYLADRAKSDPDWTVQQVALGDEPGEAELLVAATPMLTSLLHATERGRRHYQSLRTTRTETVRIERLDAVLDELAPRAERILLKTDTQGFELQVLRGASGILDRVVAIHVELSLQAYYDGAPDYLETLAWLRDRRFEPVDIVPGAMLEGLLGEADCLLRRVERDQPGRRRW